MQTQNEHKDLKNEILTIKEVAAYLRVSRATAWRWCQQGTLPAARVGGSWRIHRDDVLSLLETIDIPGSTAGPPGRAHENASGQHSDSGK